MTPGRVIAALLGALTASLALAVGPPPREPEEVTKRIAQLADDDLATRRAAMRQLEALGGRAVPALRRAAREHADVDARLRACVVARAIHDKEWGLVKAFGPGAAVTTPGSGYWFNRVAFSRDGKLAVVGGGAVVVYDLATGKELRRVLEEPGARPGLDVSRDGKHVLTGHGSNRAVRLLELATLRAVWSHEGRGAPAAVALSPDGRLAAAALGPELVLLDARDRGQEVRRFPTERGAPRAVAFSADGKRLIAGLSGPPGEDLVVVFEVATARKVRSFRGHVGAVTGVAIRPDGKTAVSAGTDGTLRVWDVTGGKELRQMRPGGHINDLAVSPDGRRGLTAGFRDRVVKVWDLEEGRQVDAFEGHMGAVLGVAFAPDGRRALSCDAVACVRLWKLGR